MTRAVVFDWRGTLVTTLTERRWIEEALRAVGRAPLAEVVDRIVAAVRAADGTEGRLDARGVDCDAAVHRRTDLDVFAAAGLDDELAGSLYAVESDLRHNRFALDVGETLRLLRASGIRIAVVSDIHVDLRPASGAVGLEGLVVVFALSSERGRRNPIPGRSPGPSTPSASRRARRSWWATAPDRRWRGRVRHRHVAAASPAGRHGAAAAPGAPAVRGGVTGAARRTGHAVTRRRSAVSIGPDRNNSTSAQ